MYEIPRYRIRAYVRNLRRSRKQIQRYSQKFHLLRSPAEIRVVDGGVIPFRPVMCRVVLNELSSAGVYLYSSDALRPGQIISLTIQEPRLFYCKGRVVDCQPIYRSGAVISDRPTRFRIAIEFQFKTHEERETVCQYCDGFLRERLYEAAHA